MFIETSASILYNCQNACYFFEETGGVLYWQPAPFLLLFPDVMALLSTVVLVACDKPEARTVKFQLQVISCLSHVDESLLSQSV